MAKRKAEEGRQLSSKKQITNPKATSFKGNSLGLSSPTKEICDVLYLSPEDYCKLMGNLDHPGCAYFNPDQDYSNPTFKTEQS